MLKLIAILFTAAALAACPAADEVLPDVPTSCVELCDWDGDGRADAYTCEAAGGPCVCWPEPGAEVPLDCDPVPGVIAPTCEHACGAGAAAACDGDACTCTDAAGDARRCRG